MKQEMENSSKASDAMKSGQHGATVEPGEGGDPKNGSLEANDSNAVQKTKEENDRTRIKEATDSPKAKDNLADPGGADPVSKSDEKSKDVEVGSGDETEGAPAASLDEKSQANATDKPNSDKVSAKGYSEAMEERKDEAAADGASLEKNDAGKEQTNGPADNNSDDDPFAGLDDVASMDIYDLSNYTFGKKNQESKSRVMQLIPKAEMTKILEKKYEERGMRRSVGGVILVHAHNFPHILLLQRSDGKGEYALPGGRLRPGESDEEGLQRKLNTKLKPEGQKGAEDDQELDIGERICNWYAIDFHRRYYPYVPAHVTKVKEELHVYNVLLPNKFMFSVPKNLQLVAVPLFELFNNSAIYGDVISAIPALLSRWHINYC